jgi:threonine dehydratase
LPEVGRFADGVAVKQIGEVTYQIAKEVVDEVVLVSNDEICAAKKIATTIIIALVITMDLAWVREKSAILYKKVAP